ncbi:MAG: DUF4405 domain-containing protein [Acidobacteria bacterium]|nr:DUF4405 domain-containing protein [Acidobacteriota bacterium]
MQKKAKTNLIIDGIMLLLMAAVGGIGFLIKFVLLPGRVRNIKYGSNVELYFFGLDRHQWGTIHLFLGLILLGLLVVHILFHWKMIAAIYRNLLVRGRKARWIAGILFGLATLFLFCFPLLVKPEIEPASGKGRFKISQEKVYEKPSIEEGKKKQPHLPDEEKSKTAETEKNRLRDHQLKIRGYMTLGEISRDYGIPLNYLKEKLNLPEYISPYERLGLLRRRYGLRMSEVIRVIEGYRHNNKTEAP